jgi:hypothetical protein
MPKRNDIAIEESLVLHQWMLQLFGYTEFDRLAEQIKDSRYEGLTEDNNSRFHFVLKALLPKNSLLTADLLLAYDENIIRHWTRITEKRNLGGQQIRLKYFQYLALLFTEIYLDSFFRDPNNLVTLLNDYVQAFNKAKSESEKVALYSREQINKLAYWQATGSGKTLLLHINLLQFWYYQQRYGQEITTNRVILLTPNEGLSEQHLREFELSGITAELFRKETPRMFAGKTVEIIDIHKLREDMGDKTVAISAFETNNLVFVDEGHRGSSGDDWKTKRDRLCERGFSFEYSATFGQAVRAAAKPDLTQEYARCIITDYSYKFFYRDGYGKDYKILNLEEDEDDEIRQLYLTACLVVFYQQMRLYYDYQNDFRPYLVEKPLLVLVGGSVNSVFTRNRRKVSDVVDVVLFLSYFVSQRNQAEEYIRKLLTGASELRDSYGNEIFANAFVYLSRQAPADIYDDVLRIVFNCSAQGAIHVEDLRGIEGEIGLSVGENTYFAVINVGDTTSLRKLLDEHQELVVRQREFGESLFSSLNTPSSNVNLLIGSKKFTEGWNSWRVSTMGLMSVGRGEGSEIIQLFGRGVRLKGYQFGLKRSRRLEDMEPPKYLEKLETLNVFGVRANYMQQFKQYLEEEGLPANEQRIEFVLPVIHNLGQKKLRIVRVKPDINYKRDGAKPFLDSPPEQLLRHPVIVDWYPKIQATHSLGVSNESVAGNKHEAKLSNMQLAFISWQDVYFELLRFKRERGWHNLNISRAAIEQLFSPEGNAIWYRLLIPPSELELRNYNQVRVWQNIVVALLKKYCDKYYKYRQSEFEAPNLEYHDLSEDDANFIEAYHLLIEESQQALIQKLQDLKQQILEGDLVGAELGSIFQGIAFGNLLYEPLIFIKSKNVEISPVALNEGERDFVLHLQEYYVENRSHFEHRELYLLRNLSRGKGIGFFEAGNFYPDFILWIITEGKQYVTFVDPKGIRNLHGFGDEKIQFCQTIKNLEERLADDHMRLNSFIISNTAFEAVNWWEVDATKEDFENQNVLFQSPDHAYITTLINRIMAR